MKTVALLRMFPSNIVLMAFSSKEIADESIRRTYIQYPLIISEGIYTIRLGHGVNLSYRVDEVCLYDDARHIVQ